LWLSVGCYNSIQLAVYISNTQGSTRMYELLTSYRSNLILCSCFSGRRVPMPTAECCHEHGTPNPNHSWLQLRIPRAFFSLQGCPSLPSSPVWERTRSWSSVVVAVTLLWEEKRGAVSGDSRAAIPLLNHWCHVRRMETGSIARHRFRCSVLLSSKRKLLVRAYHLSRPLCFPFFFGVVVLCDSDVRGMTLPSLI
jgi:hypothetical protein